MRFSVGQVSTIVGIVIGAAVSTGEMPSTLEFIFQRVAIASKTQKPVENVTDDGSEPPIDNQGPPTVIKPAQSNPPLTNNTIAKPGTTTDAGKSGVTTTGKPPEKPPEKPIPGTNKKEAAQVAHAGDDVPVPNYSQARSPLTLIGLALLGGLVGGAIGSYIGGLLELGLKRWENMAKGDRVTVFLGCVLGIIVSLSLVSIIQGFVGAYMPLVLVPLMVLVSSTAVYMLQSMEEALPWYNHAGNRRKSGIKILDTNVLIDGRIYDVIRCGFLEGQLYVPQFVINELQHIADSSDSQRRQRGRRGLDVLKRVQVEWNVEVGTQDRFAADPKEEVDSRLVRLAKALGADLVTNDYNLNKVAAIQQVTVLNINDLVTSLRPNVLPGEKLDLIIIREGSQAKQGVGYLDDGTMVVVENAQALIGLHATVEVTQVIQTERGKMIFADAGGGNEPEGSEPRRSVKPRLS